MPIKRESQLFREAFAKVLLNRTGVAMTATTFNREQMDRELELAHRLEGHAGDGDAKEEVTPSDEATGGWSDNAEELLQMIQQLGPRNANLSSEAFLKSFFRHLRLPELAIREIDDDCAKFSQLTYLDVSRNPLTSITQLPPSLKFLKAYNTDISKVSCKPLSSLCFLGLGHSRMGAEGLEQAARRFRNLLSVDLSYTEVGGLQEMSAHLQPLQQLRHLCVAGSPVSLLPYYRLRTLGWLPQLQVLDGVAVCDEEAADAQLLATSVAPPRPPMVRIAVQTRRISGVRALLLSVAEKARAAKRAALLEESGAEGGEGAAAEGEDTDPIAEFCATGSLHFRFELPHGDWAHSSEVPVSQAAAVEDGEPFDTFDLSRLVRASGERLYFEIDVSEAYQEPTGEDKLLRLCRWLRRGLPLKVFYTPEPPPAPEGGEAAAGDGEAAEPGKPAPPEAVPIGGVVVPLDVLLWRATTGITEQERQEGVLPASPGPWNHEVSGIKVVPEARWLNAEVQVPLAKQSQHADHGQPAASLDVGVVVYAEEPPELEELVEVEEPAAKAKGKK
mmetsp:Transcript_61520/g.135232  ORF Transcript_61520/g.135232 Transcript_61520/m.135232 type:complete len:559 (-) Transcript_61520:36-1712(-)